MDAILLSITAWAVYTEALYDVHTGESFDVTRVAQVVDHVISTDEFKILREKFGEKTWR